MLRVRPAQQRDIPELVTLAQKAGRGMTTMPQSERGMSHRIYLSQEAFARPEPEDKAETFFMVLEHENKVIGTSSIFTNLGADRPFYSYRMSRISNQSPDLNIRADTHVLYLVNDYHGYTEIGTLFVDPDFRGAGAGRLLSFSRFMLMAANPGRFGERLMAEIRGWSDNEESFPFWEHVASKFFDMDFAEADRRSASDFRFIADLMPKYPIYADLLPPDAQEILAKPHDQSRAAMELLFSQGFRHRNLIDIFDGGPSIEVDITDIDVIRNARTCTAVTGVPAETGTKALVSTTGLSEFSCIQVVCAGSSDDQIILSKEQFEDLGIGDGDDVLVSHLSGRQK